MGVSTLATAFGESFMDLFSNNLGIRSAQFGYVENPQALHLGVPTELF
jgi:hypothetical protein